MGVDIGGSCFAKQFWEPDAATLSVLSGWPRTVPTAGSEMPAVMRHLCLKCIQSFSMASAIWSWDSAGSSLLQEHPLPRPSGRLNSVLGAFTTWDGYIAFLEFLCKGGFLNKNTQISVYKMGCGQKKERKKEKEKGKHKKIKNEVDQRSTQNHPTSF